MVLSRPPDRTAEPVDVVELDAETYYAFAAASIREEPYGNDEEVVAGLVELDHRMERLADVTWFGATVDGEPVSRASLYLADGMAQVEDVATLEPYRNRGLARATVSRAILEAQRAGADPIVILADLHDWPWRLYEKLGFDRVAVEVGLLRPRARVAVYAPDSLATIRGVMGEGIVEVRFVQLSLTRHELVVLREAVELTPNFRGRPAARDAVTAGVRTRRSKATVSMPLESARGLAAQLVPTEITLVMVRAKLRRAIDAAGTPSEPDLPAASTG